LAIGLAVVALLGHPATVKAQLAQPAPPYLNPLDLGTFGGPASNALDINETGDVVGWAKEPGQVDAENAYAFRYRASLQNLGTLGGTGGGEGVSSFILSDGRAIDDAGEVVGRALASNPSDPFGSFLAGTHAFLYKDGRMQDISPTNTGAFAEDINKSGSTVVGGFDNDGGQRPFVWTADSKIRNLYKLGCGFRADQQGAGWAYGVNDAGVIVGEAPLEGALAPGLVRHAFRCTPTPSGTSYTTTDIGFGSLRSRAYRINNAGEIVGQANDQAVKWNAFGISIPLGLGPEGKILPENPSSVAYDINQIGDVVGSYFFRDQPVNPVHHAFLYRRGVMYDLNDLLPPGSPWELNEARGINDSGQIAGTGTINGQKHAFRLTPSANVDIKATKIEVAQTVQDVDNHVPLIAAKRTFAIVHAQTDHNPANGVTAKLYGERSGTSLGAPRDPQNNLSKRINLVSSPSRISDTDSFIFELPADWISQGPLTLRAEVNPDRTVNETEWANNTISTGVTFEKPDFLNLRLFNIVYDDAQGTPHKATPRDQDLLASQFRRMYPAKIHAMWQDKKIPFSPPDLDKVRELEGSTRLNNLLLETKKTLASLDKAHNHEAWYAMVTDTGGVMRGSAPIGSHVGSGPTGIPLGNFSWDKDGSYGDWMATHEVSHALGLWHAPFCGAVAGPADHPDNVPYPYPNGEIGGPANNPNQYAGYDAGDPRAGYNLPQRTIPSAFHDNMTYCPNQWMSNHNYKMLGEKIQKLNTYEPSLLERVFSLNGVIDLASEKAELLYTSQLSAADKGAASTGPYHVRLLDANNKVLLDYPFTPDDASAAESERSSERPVGIINEVVPSVDGTRRIAIYSDVAGREIGSIDVSLNPPTVAIEAPSANASLPPSGQTTISWSGSDPDNQPLEYTVLYSKDNKVSWQPLAVRTQETTLTVDSAALPGGTQAFIRVIANDGVNTGYADVGPLSVPDKAPTASILSPGPDATYATGQAVPLEAEGTDLEDDQLPDDAFSWSSDKDGQLGTGPLYHALNLSVGTHTITLAVEDSKGHTTTETTTVNIVSDVPQQGPTLAVDMETIPVLFDHDSTTQTKVLGIRNSGSGGAMMWKATSDDSRVTLDASYGVTPANLGVNIDTAGLPADTHYTAHITITSPGSEPRVVTVSASSIEPPVVLNKQELDFGKQTAGAEGPAQEVTLTYRGTGTLPLGATSLGGGAPTDFVIGSDTCKDADIARSNTCKVTLKFKPSEAGQRSGYLILSHRDSTAKEYVKLTGEGAVPESKVFAWGLNTQGQVGVTGSTTANCTQALSFPNLCEPLPKEVTTLQDVKKVAAGGQHSLAIKEDGTLWAWGDNSSGQLGDGTSDGSAHPLPTKVPDLTQVKDVAASSAHSVAVKEDGTVWAWGLGDNGELGGGSRVFSVRPSPQQVKGENGVGYLTDVEAVAAADLPQGRMSMALKSDGTIWTWGFNWFGVLATGSTEDYITSPRPIVGPGGTGLLTDVKAIAPGMALKEDGTVWTWGDGANGQLGTGQTPVRSTVPVQVQDPSGGPLKNIVAIASTSLERYALTSDGKVWAWGRFNLRFNGTISGQILGIGPDYPRGTAIPRPVVSPDSSNPNGLSDVAVLQPNMVIRTDGTVWTWGASLFSGELGTGCCPTSSSRPVQVKSADGNGFLTNVVAIASGGRHRIAVVGAAQTQKDTIPPQLNLPAEITEEATGPDGRTVNFEATATDEDPTSPDVTCSPASGSTFPIGETTVACSATDAAGNKAGGTFKIIVSDTTAPEVEITQGPDGWINENNATFGWTGSDSATPTADLLYSHKLDSGSWSDFSADTSVTLQDLGDGEHTFYVKAKDKADNEQGEATQRIFKVDTTPPSIRDDGHTPEQPNAHGWYNGQVTNTFTASDGDGSGLADSAKATFEVASEGEGSQVTIDSGPISDVAGNEAEGIEVGPFQIDLTDPVIDISDAPSEGASVDVCEGKPALSFTAQDALSGIATTNAPGVLAKPNTDTGVGAYSYEATATDKADNDSKITRTYKVAYGGAFGGVIQPINLGDQRSVFKLGSTVPVKFKLTCANQPITNAVAKLSVQRVDGTVEGPVNEAVSTLAATTGNQFRYDETSQQYVFNLSTKGSFNGGAWSFSTGTWRLIIELDDGSKQQALIDLGK